MPWLPEVLDYAGAPHLAAFGLARTEKVALSLVALAFVGILVPMHLWPALLTRTSEIAGPVALWWLWLNNS